MKNKELLELIREKAAQIACENCKYCNLGAYHRGKWYCENPEISIFDVPVEIEQCFVSKEGRWSRTVKRETA